MFRTAEPNPWRIALGLALCGPLGCAGGCMGEERPEPRSRTEGVLISTPVAQATRDAGASAVSTPEVAPASSDAGAPTRWASMTPSPT